MPWNLLKMKAETEQNVCQILNQWGRSMINFIFIKLATCKTASNTSKKYKRKLEYFKMLVFRTKQHNHSVWLDLLSFLTPAFSENNLDRCQIFSGLHSLLVLLLLFEMKTSDIKIFRPFGKFQFSDTSLTTASADTWERGGGKLLTWKLRCRGRPTANCELQKQAACSWIVYLGNGTNRISGTWGYYFQARRVLWLWEAADGMSVGADMAW
jgi:hypothetical protein